MHFSTFFYLSIAFIYIIWYYFFSDRPNNRGKKSKIRLTREELMYMAVIRKADVIKAKVALQQAESAQKLTLKELEEATDAVKKEIDKEFDDMLDHITEKFRKMYRGEWYDDGAEDEDVDEDKNDNENKNKDKAKKENNNDDK